MRSFYGCGEPLDPIDVEIQLKDDDYDTLEALAEESRDREESLTERAFEQEMPELYQHLMTVSATVDGERQTDTI